jgi:hypothetical protein
MDYANGSGSAALQTRDDPRARTNRALHFVNDPLSVANGGLRLTE